MSTSSTEHAGGPVLPLWIRTIDRVSDAFAVIAKWALLLACVISGGNAIVRYAIGVSSNGWLEIQWYLFAVGVMLGAAQVLRLNEHVRVPQHQHQGRREEAVERFVAPLGHAREGEQAEHDGGPEDTRTCSGEPCVAPERQQDQAPPGDTSARSATPPVQQEQ